VVLLREVPAPSASGFEVLLVRRARELEFHGGAWVFPGGRVDPSEHEAGDPLASARRAAVRETAEEAGLRLDAEALVPFSHWTTPLGMPRRFATWFFLATLPSGAEVRVDGGEIRAHRWLPPEAALTLHAARELELPPPTFVTLSVLSGFSRAHEVLTQARTAAPSVFVPRPCPSPEGLVSLYEGDAGYEAHDLTCAGPRHRLCMFGRSWRYERSG
jgi:8-oxo-dGTP pyrophosphatase MutT (NUDIX family)